MPKPEQENLEQLDTVLDRMLNSEDFRRAAAHSGMDILEVAAILMDAPKPQLPPASRKFIHQQMLNALEDVAQANGILPDHLTDAEIAEIADDHSVYAADRLIANRHPELSESARGRIFEHMMAHVVDDLSTEPTLSHSARERIFGPVLEAQQQLQIDALVDSDEALEIAAENPDPVVQAAVRLRTAAHPTLSAETKAEILDYILPKEERQQRRILRPNFAASMQRVAASIAILLFVSLLAIPPASANSLPGDVLYPVKRGLEVVSLQFAASDEGRADIHLTQAEERIEEMTILLNQDTYLPELLDDAFDSLEAANTIATQNEALDQDMVFQNNFAANIASLDAMVTSYRVVLDAESQASYIARQNALSTTTIEVPDKSGNDPLTEDATLTEEATMEPSETVEPIIVTAEASEETIVEVSLTAEPTIEASTVQVDVPVLETSLYVNVDNHARVRSEPSINAPVIATVGRGDTVTQIGMSADSEWIQVRLVDGQIGWMASILLVDYPVNTTIDAATEPANSGNASGNANGQGNGNANGQGTGNDNGQANGNANGQGNGQANGNANGQGNGNANGQANN